MVSAVLATCTLLSACTPKAGPSPPRTPSPPAFKVPAPGQATVLSIAFPGADSDPTHSQLAWAAGPVAAGPDGTVLIADIDSDGGRVAAVARDGARSHFGGAHGPTGRSRRHGGRGRRDAVRHPAGPDRGL
jgi:hypothetical protein